jgi:hypothetical protein
MTNVVFVEVYEMQPAVGEDQFGMIKEIELNPNSTNMRISSNTGNHIQSPVGRRC